MNTNQDDCGCGGGKPSPDDQQVTSRREFLVNTARASAALALTGAVLSSSANVSQADPPTNVIQYGLCMHRAGIDYEQDNQACRKKPKNQRPACFEKATKDDNNRRKAREKQYLMPTTTTTSA